ncbi:uncharacterized protein LOC132266652 isoform X2 [Cornus florida]|uniref:uncharacterized protein LOC132266652 isoform X2 n=1 Tax=Cornus florida TaxID=4283 RepID=UPI00289F5DA9|nr:uncharacterized protein LOC132266652 isoform X2 [Cornus florida]
MGRRGRGRKRKEKYDSSTEDSFNCPTHNSPVPSRHLTQHSKAVLGQGSNSRYPVRSNRWIPSHCSTLAPSSRDSTGTDISIPSIGDIPISEKITSEIPIQIQAQQVAVLSAPKEVVSDNHLSIREAIEASNIVGSRLEGSVNNSNQREHRSTRGIPSHSSILTPSKRDFTEKDISSPATGNIPTSEKITSELPLQTQVSNSPAASLMHPSQHEKMTPNHTGTPRLAKRGKKMDNSISKTNTNNDEVVSPQTQAQLVAALSAPHEVVSDNHLSIREANEASNIVGSTLEGTANNGNEREEHESTRGITNHSYTLTPSKMNFTEMDISSPATRDIPTSEKITSELPLQTQVSNSPVASLMSPSQHEKMITSHTGSPRLAKEGKTIGNINNVSISHTNNVEVHRENLISEVILPQTQEGEELNPAAALSAHHVIVSDKHLLTREANKASNIVGSIPEGSASNGNQREVNLGQTLSLNLTEMAETLDDDLDEVGSFLDPALVTVNGYRVKPEWASLLRAIFLRYGDIAKDCCFVSTIRSRSFLLEIICEIIQKLQDTEFVHFTPADLNSMLDQVCDLETAKLEVGWLRQRLDDISEAMRLFRGYSNLKEAQRSRIQAIEKKKEELKSFKGQILALQERVVLAEDELTPMKAEAEKIDETITESKAKVKCFYQQSLVHGLL